MIIMIKFKINTTLKIPICPITTLFGLVKILW